MAQPHLDQAPASESGHDHEHAHAHAHEHHPGVRGLLASVLGHSHNHADSVDDALTSSARGIRAVKVSLVGLGLTAVAQLAVVLVSGSVALLADTIHNFSDALTAIPLWIAFALGSRAATRRYTFGYRRAEDLAGLFVLVMILGSAILAGYESINRLINPVVISNIPIVMAAGFIGFAGNEAVALYRIRIGREIGSAALVADGYHARTDGLTSLAVVVGALGVALGYPAADPLVGLLITVAILFVLRQATGQMLGRLMDAVEPELVDQVEEVARSTPEVQDVSRLRVRWVGHALEASMAITVDCDLSVGEGHRIAEQVRHRLLHEVGKLDTAVIHVNPCGHDGADPHEALRHHEILPAPPTELDAPDGVAAARLTAVMSDGIGPEPFDGALCRAPTPDPSAMASQLPVAAIDERPVRAGSPATAPSRRVSIFVSARRPGPSQAPGRSTRPTRQWPPSRDGRPTAT